MRLSHWTRPTRKKTLEMILASGNDYLVALKANQPRLYRQVTAITEDCPPLFPPLTRCHQQHGRQEQRCLRVFSAHHINAEQWPQVRTLLCIDRQTTCQGQTRQHRAYYISSVQTAPAQWMNLIQGHWAIENR